MSKRLTLIDAILAAQEEPMVVYDPGALHNISRKFTLAEAALRDIAQYPLPARGESLARIAREALEAISTERGSECPEGCPAWPDCYGPGSCAHIPWPEEPMVVYDPGRSASVTLTLTLEQAQAVFDRLYVYETDPGYLDREIVARRLRESGAVQVDA